MRTLNEQDIEDLVVGTKISNWRGEFSKGRKVVFTGILARGHRWTKRRLEIFGPMPFGFDQCYTPPEKMVKKLSRSGERRS